MFTIKPDTLVSIKTTDKLSKGIKLNAQNKQTLQNVPLSVLTILADALEIGQLKGYPLHNWLEGVPVSVATGALLRHLDAYLSGEDFNIEPLPDGRSAKIPHVAGILINALFLAMAVYNPKEGQDDRHLKSLLTNGKVKSMLSILDNSVSQTNTEDK